MTTTAQEQRDGGVLTLLLNRPEVRNAIDDAMRTELLAALDRVQADPEVRVVVLRGRRARSAPVATSGTWVPDRGSRAADGRGRGRARMVTRAPELFDLATTALPF